MLLRNLFILVSAVLFLAGCGGGNNPINDGADMPVHLKKDKDKKK